MNHLLGRLNLVGALLARRRTEPMFAEWFRRAGVGLQSSILDVGCGQGHLLHRLRGVGFSNLTGVDPHVTTETKTQGLHICRSHISDIDSVFDLVMSHHALEHMPEPVDALNHIARVTKPGGTVLIRVPIAGSELWKQFGTDWVALDAPRHLAIPSAAALKCLGEQVGLELTGVVFDSWELSVLGSLQYAADIPLHDKRSYFNGGAGDLFDTSDVASARADIDWMNHEQTADNATFYFCKPTIDLV